MASQGLQILLPDGDPNGIKIIELANWAGKTFIVPRAKLKAIKDRPEALMPGVYFLIGQIEDPASPEVYIGESEMFYQRLVDHDGKKDFWETVIVFTGGLNRADVKYLENKSVLLAKKINRYKISNSIEPLENKLSEYQKAAADSYFKNIKFILAVFGYALFQEVPKRQDVEEIYYWKTDGADAKGAILETGELIVFKGSTARIRETDSFSGTGGSILRFRLRDEGIMKQINDQSYEFTQDFIFKSPSAASDTVAGRSTNGWSCWKDERGKTLDENKRK